MKKSISLVVSVLVILTLMLSLTGCDEQKKFVGSWESSVDMTDYINQEMAKEEEELAEYLKIKEFELVLKMTFKDDGTYKASIDEKELEKTLESAKEDFKEGMNKYFEAYIDSMELDLTVDEVLEASGVDMDSLIEEAFGDELYSSFTDELSSEGNFKVKDGKLYLSDGLDKDIEEDVYDTYEISENELKLIESFGDDEEDSKEMDLYAKTFKRVD